MTRTFIARSLLALTTVFCAAYWSASFTDVVSSSMGGTGANLSRAQQTASPTPTPVHNGSLPVVSPDGSRIAFTSDRGGANDLFVISPDGSDERQLTHTTEAEDNLGWTANGKQILFSVFKDNQSRLYAIDSDGNNQRELASVPGRAPTLSPDGKRLVYMAGTWTATRLMVSALDGSNARQINDGSSIAWNNHWSPDGKRIAFTGRDNPQSELAVFVMNADGLSRQQITHVPAEEGGAQWPVWAPDGLRLAIQVNSRSQQNSAHIWIVDVSTGEAHKLAAHSQPYLDETPSWFPDGKRIAFQSNRTGRMEVWVMNSDGSGARQVTGALQSAQSQRMERHATLPVATRDGKRILFSSNRDGRPQVYSMNVDGTDERRLSDSTTFDVGGDWSPDGKWIALTSFSADDSLSKIVAMSADGSKRRTVATGKDARWPRISPNGRRIAFIAIDDKGANTVFTVNVDGLDLRPFPTGLAEAWDPEWSPNGQQLLFGLFPSDTKHPEAFTSSIYIAEISGNKRRLLATTPGIIQLPRWSPDGRRVAFQTYTGGTDANIILLDVVTGTFRTVTHHDEPYLDETPSWLPDGRLLFQSNRTGKFEVWLMNVDGSGQRQLTGAPQPAAAKPPVTLGGDPRVSPNGSRILFVSNRTGTYHIYVMRADGSTLRQLTNGSSGSFLGNWSPDGKRIVYYKESTGQIVIMNEDGSGPRVISEVKGDQLPSWSPDGLKILFAARTFPNINIYTMNVDSKERRNVSPNPGFDYDPAWSPDGKTIALVTALRGQGPRVWLMNADGTNRRRVTTSSDAEERPAWSRERRLLAFQSAKRGSGVHDAYIHVVDIATGTDRRLGAHDQPYLDETPSWFPDGRRIAFQSDRTGQMKIWIMNADGSNQRPLQK